MEPETRKSRLSISEGPQKSRMSGISVGQSQMAQKTFEASQGKSLSRMKVRRPSYGFAGVPGVRPVERTSQLAIEFKRPPLVYLPTFQLDPSLRFNNAVVMACVDELLDEHFTGHKYNGQESPTLALRLAGEIMRRVKTMQFNRYRIISIVTIGQKRSQSYNNAVTFLWDFERDTYVDTQREVTTAFVHVTVFGIYLD